MDNTNHAMAWIRDHVGNAEYCKQLLERFSSSWKYVMADLAGRCRRKIFPKYTCDQLISMTMMNMTTKDNNNSFI